jgi:hypothetical protein
VCTSLLLLVEFVLLVDRVIETVVGGRSVYRAEEL